MNHIQLVGRIVREMTCRQTKQGTSVLNNVIAVRRKREYDDQTADFIPFVAWGGLADRLNQYVQKGHLVGLSGSIQSKTYTNKQNETVYTLEMVVNEVTFLQPKEKSESDLDDFVF